MNFGSKVNWTFLIVCLLENAIRTILEINTASMRFFLMLIAVAANVYIPMYRKSFAHSATAIWGLWTLYSIINWYICPHGPLEYKEIYYIGGFVKTYFFLVILTYEASLNFKKTLQILIFVIVCYFIVGVLGQGNGPVKDSESWAGRGGTLLGNHFPLAMMCGVFVFMIARIKSMIGSKTLYLFIFCTVGVILWVATRKAMYGVFILCLFYVLSNVDFKKKSNILYLVFGTGVIYIAYELIMKYTLLGSRVDQLDEFEYSVDVPVHLQFLGDRAIQYVLAWDVFLEHPINGVGLGNSMDYTGLSIPLHTEYMEQLCEGGIIGMTLYLGFIIKIMNLIYIYYKNKDVQSGIVMAGGMVMLLFISMSAWLYNMPIFFMIYAIIIAYCNPLKVKLNN